MRYLRYGFLGALAVVLISVSMANRGGVELRLLPDELAAPLGIAWSVDLPLFIVILASVIAGLLIGFFWEWLREYKHRAEASRKAGEVRQLRREMSQMKGTTEKGEPDDVLAILDGTR